MKTYCLDTSVLINGWNKHYRRDVFPHVWDELGRRLACGQARVPWEVYKEIDKQADELREWISQYKEFIKRPSSDELRLIRDLMAIFPNMAAQGGSINAADPWVIVSAQSVNGIVVTDEKPQAVAKPTKPPKITFVCEQLGIPWMAPIDFLADILAPLGRSA